MVSQSAQVKLAIVSINLLKNELPLDAIAEKLRDWFGLELSERQIASVFSYWRRLGIPIEHRRFNYSEEGYVRARAVYSIDEPKSIKRLLDTIYN